MTTELPDRTSAASAPPESLYRKDLRPRQVQMIAIGGAIGTGLFMGAGGRLAGAGPALVGVYAVCGFFGFLILRALGELVVHRPTSGSFVSYAREFFGERTAFVAGWLYWLNWATTAVVDVTAVALYMNFFGRYWAPIASVDQWVWALAAIVVVLALNLLSVKVFGELEFWFALLKVGTLAVFLVVGTYFVVFGEPIDGQEPGFGLIEANGAGCPTGCCRRSSSSRASSSPTPPSNSSAPPRVRSRNRRRSSRAPSTRSSSASSCSTSARSCCSRCCCRSTSTRRASARSSRSSPTSGSRASTRS